MMQWVTGLEGDSAYPVLSDHAISVAFRGGTIHVCGLEQLLAMKRAAGRDDDPRDLRELER